MGEPPVDPTGRVDIFNNGIKFRQVRLLAVLGKKIELIRSKKSPVIFITRLCVPRTGFEPQEDPSGSGDIFQNGFSFR